MDFKIYCRICIVVSDCNNWIVADMGSALVNNILKQLKRRGKKVKCMECDNSLNWALPVNVSKENLDYAKYCLRIASRSIVCDRQMKSRRKNHEQYCKHFVPAERSRDDSKQLENLKKMIEEYEKGCKE